MQAYNKAAMESTFSAMGKPRRKKVPSPFRKVLARNVILRSAVQFRDSPNVPMAIREKTHEAERERLSKSYIQLIIAGGASPTLEQLEKLARALDLQPYQLLLPNLDENNPQVAKGAIQGEEQVYQIARRAAQDALAESLATTPPKPRKRP